MEFSVTGLFGFKLDINEYDTVCKHFHIECLFDANCLPVCTGLYILPFILNCGCDIQMLFGFTLLIWGPFHERFFDRNSNSMENLFCSYRSGRKVIGIQFCTWHDNCPVVACTQFCCLVVHYNGVTLEPLFHPIWIPMEKSFVKWAAGVECHYFASFY